MTMSEDENELTEVPTDQELSFADQAMVSQMVFNDLADNDEELAPLCPDCKKPLQLKTKHDDLPENSGSIAVVCGCDELRRFTISPVNDEP